MIGFLRKCPVELYTEKEHLKTRSWKKDEVGNTLVLFPSCLPVLFPTGAVPGTDSCLLMCCLACGQPTLAPGAFSCLFSSGESFLPPTFLMFSE